MKIAMDCYCNDENKRMDVACVICKKVINVLMPKAERTMALS
jgi:hypothetical protein